MLWVVAWVIALLVFLLVPVFLNEDSRNELIRKLTCQRVESTETESPPANPASSDNSTEAYHYVLSKAQEDEIRESYLIETLSHFTKKLPESSIIKQDEGTKDGSNNGEDLEYLMDGENPANDDHSVDEDLEAPTKTKGKSVGYDTADDSSLEGGSVDGFLDEPLNQVIIPAAGVRRDSCDDLPAELLRRVPNGCTICLGRFKPGDRVTWSNNKNCSHVFHNECILDWLIASGRKALRRQRRTEDHTELRYVNNPLLKITNFAMLCPCCRQDFMLKPSEPDIPKENQTSTRTVDTSNETTPATNSSTVDEPEDLESGASNRAEATETTQSSANAAVVEAPQVSELQAAE